MKAAMIFGVAMLIAGGAQAQTPSLQKNPEFMALTTCQFKVAHEAIVKKGKFDADDFITRFVWRCSDKIINFKSAGNEPILAMTILRNFAFIQEKIKSEGLSSFDMYDQFDYDGRVINTK